MTDSIDARPSEEAALTGCVAGEGGDIATRSVALLAVPAAGARG